MWELEYSQAANNYALDSHPYNEEVLIAIEMLALTEDAMPAQDCRQLEPTIYLWVIAGHTVIFQRFSVSQVLRILMIQPEE